MHAFVNWVEAHAEELDQSPHLAEEVLPALARAGLPGVGVPVSEGGGGGDIRDAVDAIGRVAEKSLTVALTLWGHRSFIEFLLNSANADLRDRLLPRLLDGSLAGATGLSNAMKFLAGLENLQITAAAKSTNWLLRGRIAWASNLRKEGFAVAVAAALDHGTPPMVVAADSGTQNLRRSSDLDLTGLRASNTAAICLEDALVRPDDIIAVDAGQWLPSVRPAFLGMQCGLFIGLARASLHRAAEESGGPQNPYVQQIDSVRRDLERTVDSIMRGIEDGSFRKDAPRLLQLRLRLAVTVQQAVMLELQAMGGRAYMSDHQNGFARRWREAAFVPIITPRMPYPPLSPFNEVR